MRGELVAAIVLVISSIWCAAGGNEIPDEDPRGKPPPPTAYVWKTGSWGSCYTAQGCGEGEQQRSIWCAHMDGRTTLEFLCDSQERPPKTRTCFRVCEEHRGRLAWRVGVWGPCLPTEGEGPELVLPPPPGAAPAACPDRRGAMRRDVVCVYRRHKGDHPKVVDDEACDHFEMKPKDRLSCQVPCAQDCVVAPFSKWLPCTGCGPGNRTRTRPVLVAPQHGGRLCPTLAESEPCNEAVACLQSPHHPREYRLWTGSWGPCLPMEPPLPEGTSPYTFRASLGYQTREVACRDPSGNHVDMSYCIKGEKSKLPGKVQACIVPADCIMSSWSSWKVVADGCITSNDDVRPELRKRTRHVLQLPLGGGKPCPHLEELHRVTDKSQLPLCTKYKWLPSEWSDCVLTNQTNVKKVACGGGVQLRNLTCLRSDDLVPVPHSYCSETPPPIIQRCSVPCQQDCQVSPWSAWGGCRPLDCRDPLSLQQIGYRERWRTIVQPPSPDGVDCPPLRQVDVCVQPSCYQWRTTNFSPCVVLNKELRCGQGKQTRKSECVDLEGNQVDEALCAIYVPEPELVVPCYIPCPSDCVLSRWAEWTPCSRICVDRDDHGLRNRNRTILAPAGLGGTPCPSTDELAETEICNQNNCYGFGWKVSTWEQCKVTNPLETCGPGEQTRDVWCMKDEDRRVSERKCVPIPKPVVRRPCSVPCPKDCILTKYTDWTPCPDACHLVGSATHTQSRDRYVLQWPQVGREPCPEALQEVRVCPTPCAEEDDEEENLTNTTVICTEPCYTYEWSLGDWGPCRLPDSVECGIGYRTRSVLCVRNDGKEVEGDLCMSGLSKAFPVITERCHVSCMQMCALSDWSEWSQCSMNCGGYQTRKRQLLEESLDNEECRNAQIYPLEERKSCPCHVYSARPEGNWSDCILDGSDERVAINGLEVTGRCGVGKRFRKVACYDKGGNLVDPLLCTPTGYEEDVCMVSCPVDCQMSRWSDWSPCSSLCGSGVRQRYRSILRPAYDGGRPCPKVDTRKMQKEVKLCFVSCDKYQWFAHGWNQCELSRHDWVNHCGTGIQNRKVRCMKVDNSTKPEVVKEDYCDPILKPVDINYCHVPCPMDCVVSDWSEWSVCPQPCDSKTTRIRTREMVREPYDSGAPCPAMKEVDPCILNENCFHYTWNTSEWSSCIIHTNAICGDGVIRRNVICLRSDGRTVSDKFCEQTGVPRPETTESWCSVDCPIDCIVSEWSDWNHAECSSCGTKGHATRTRQILVQPSEAGRPCPDALVQRKPCQARPCYHWDRSKFSVCDLEGGVCGHGISHREVTCRRADGASVDRKYCLEANSTKLIHGWMDQRWLESLLDIHEEEMCHIPCPGDCELSSWSEWSPCHRDCEAGEQGGYQSRSRAVLVHPSSTGEKCPEQLWMIRPCFGGPCYKFEWRIKDGEVVCVRSDGLFVQGGCSGKPRPCLPACRVSHSECSSHGVCMCEAGYRPQYRENPGHEGGRELVACELMQTTNSSHHTAGGSGGEIKVFYLPNENEVSFWMYAMISVGSAFIIFVAVTLYLMCQSSVRQADSPSRRHTLTIRRPLTREDHGKP